MSGESVKSLSATNNIIDPLSDYLGYLSLNKVKTVWSHIKQDKITYAHKTIINIYIIYEINNNYNISSYPTLENCFV